MTGRPDVRRPAGAAVGEGASWVATAHRIAPLLDGVEYYRALRRSLIEARRQVAVLGWDIHTEIDLLRGDEADRARRDERWPVRLADLLEHLVRERESLHVHLLIWEGASLFAFERQPFPRPQRPWSKHRRVTLRWDRETPPLASHHQKIVVIDDRVAFCGGMDLTAGRWDDHRHMPSDARRRKPGLLPSFGDPYHELMLAVDGDAARSLGDLCRRRWHRATGERLEAPAVDRSGADPWPPGVEPLLRDRPVAAAVTEPEHAGRPEKRHVEASYLSQIGSARQLVFVETQYLTCATIVEALCDRLTEDDGPEVVLNLPFGSSGALQAMALDPRRDELLDRLREADRHDRLGVYWPTVGGRRPARPQRQSVYVHAKMMIVDDRLLRIGSANLNNRSMGLDTELDLWVCVEDGDRDSIEAIAGFRRKLLGSLLGVEAERVARAERETGSTLRAIDMLRGGRRTLVPFDHRAEPIAVTVPVPVELADPDRPLGDLEAKRLLGMVDPDGSWLRRCRRAISRSVAFLGRRKWLLLCVGIVLALSLVWSLTPARQLVDRQTLDGALSAIRRTPLGPPGVALAFVVLAAVGVPVTLLVIVVSAGLELWWALPVCLAGATGSALADFWLGRLLRKRGGAVTGERLAAVARRVPGRGVLAVAVVRNVPLAPFAVVNVACGATSLSWRAFLAGTVIGMLPGILVIGILGNELGTLLGDPTPAGLVKVAAAAAAVIGAALAADAAIRRWGPDPEESGEGP